MKDAHSAMTNCTSDQCELLQSLKKQVRDAVMQLPEEECASLYLELKDRGLI